MARAARREANALSRRYPDKNAEELKLLFNYERMTKKFGRVEDFDEKQHDYRNWTFWTYATRAKEVFDPLSHCILHQLRNYRSMVRRRAHVEIERAVARRQVGTMQSRRARFGKPAVAVDTAASNFIPGILTIDSVITPPP
jgi:hypothetical protein